MITQDETWVYHYDPETKAQSMQWLPIATLNGKARLAIDLTVEQGRGYASSQREIEKQPGYIVVVAWWKAGGCVGR